ncbi:(Fe-S)-binding protein [Dehalococcoidia bacterium]|nr:(Fe-S)-binding protein [Dehalococcoidia bacterium]MCL0097845.1 (Fe-S)-binding protein [Dehalococcoidia bacterium]
METLTPFKEAVDVVLEAGGEPLKTCYQCGLCSGTCPWNLVRSFIVRRMIHQAQLGLVDFESEEVWQCATCGACVKRCPRGVEIIDIVRALRKVVAEVGVAKVPDSLRISVKNISSLGNPQGEVPEKRGDWAKDRDIRTFTEGTDLLYLSCCVPAYDGKIRRIALATTDILNKAGIDFGILGENESCCGESVRKSGSETVFQSLAESNIETFTKNGVERIMVSSPHCYHSFKNEYPEFGGKFEVIHSTQYLWELIKEKKIEFNRELKKKVAYSDPCYLGRHNEIYDAPREILRGIPGLELMELPDSREEAVCCGGGGGRIWMDTPKGERFSDLRLEQALEMGADVLAVACPYCMLNFDDSVLTMSKESLIEIKDVAELVQEAI